MELPTSKPKILLFDLGGVIVPWVGTDFLAKFNDISQNDVTARLSQSKVFHAFERGPPFKSVKDFALT